MSKRRGRRPRLTEETRNEIVSILAIGCSRRDAAAIAGIDERTLRRWMRRAERESRGGFAEFRDAVLRAEARARVSAFACLAKAIRAGDWRASEAWLRLSFPREYGPKAMGLDPDAPSPEELMRAEERRWLKPDDEDGTGTRRAS